MKINKLFSFVLGGALLFGAAACTDEVVNTPAGPVDGSGVYFPEDVATSIAIEQNSSLISLELLRTNAEGALTVELISSVTDKDGVAIANPFTIPATVSFADGSNVTDVVLTYNFDDIEPDMKYYVNLKVNTDQTTPYGLVEQTYVLSYAPWSDFKLYMNTTDPAVVTYTLFGIDARNVPVYVSESLIGAGYQYRFGNYGELTEEEEDSGIYGEDGVSYVNGYNMYITVEKDPIAGTNGRYYPAHMVPFASGDDESWGSMIYTTDVYTYRTEFNPNIYPGNTLDELREVSYFDTETGLFTIYTMWFAIDEPTSARANSREYMQLPGFKDYTLQFTYTGNFVNTKGQEVAMVEAFRSDDLASFAYTINPGALTDAQVEAEAARIEGDTSAELLFDAQITLQFNLTPGTYTIVGVGYDESGEARTSVGYTFTYKSVQVASDWETVGEVDYRDGIFYGTVTFTDGSYLGGNVYQVELQKHKTDANRYRVVNPCAYYYDYGLVLDGDYYLTFCTTSDGQHFMIEDSYVGVDLSPIGNTQGQWIMSSPVAGLVEEYGADAVYEVYPEYFGELDDDYLEFPAGYWLRMPESLYADGRGYYSNFNDALLAAFDDDSLSSAQLSENMANHVYGMGLFFADMWDVFHGAPAPRNAVKAPKLPLAPLSARVNNTKMVERINTLPGVKAKKAKKAAIRGTKLDSKQILKGTVRIDNTRIAK